jgi:cobyrinic acid a,c-diamide synthase
MWDMKNEIYLNHMPHTTPCFPRKNRGHNFHKSKQNRRNNNVNCIDKEKKDHIMMNQGWKRAYAAQGGKCGSLHHPGFSLVTLYANTT